MAQKIKHFRFGFTGDEKSPVRINRPAVQISGHKICKSEILERAYQSAKIAGWDNQ